MATQVERRTETRRAIIDAALAIFLEEDRIDASLDAVADRLYDEMGARLGPLDQYADARAFARALLRDGRSPSVRIYQQVGDHLLYRTEHPGLGRGMQYMVGALEVLGVTERVVTIAAAILMMARQVTFAGLDDGAIDAFVDDVFVLAPGARRG